WPNGVSHGLQQRILADSLMAAEHERMIDLDLGVLDAQREPIDDVIRIVAIDLADVINPWCSFHGISEGERRRPIQVVAGSALVLDPAARINKSILDDPRMAWGPGYLLDVPILVEPLVCCNRLRFILVIEDREATLVKKRYRRNL